MGGLYDAATLRAQVLAVLIKSMQPFFVMIAVIEKNFAMSHQSRTACKGRGASASHPQLVPIVFRERNHVHKYEERGSKSWKRPAAAPAATVELQSSISGPFRVKMHEIYDDHIFFHVHKVS
jgi:hypothetical protein